MKKQKKFKKVEEYFYPNGDTFNYGSCAFYFCQTIAVFAKWMFYPLFFLFNNDNDLHGTRKVYWVEIK